MKNESMRPLAAACIASALAVVAPASLRAEESVSIINACVSQDGHVRLLKNLRVDLKKKQPRLECRRGEKLITWNVTGPRGPEGPSGPIGPSGLQGTQGPQGVDGQQGEQGQQGPSGPGFSGTQYYIVGNGDLRGSGVVQSLAAAPGGAFVQTGEGRLLGGVHLPEGAHITGVTLTGFDVNVAANLRLDLIAQDLATGTPITLGVAASTGNAGAFAAPAALAPEAALPVSNSTHHYLVQLSAVGGGWGGQTLQVLGVSIAYTFE